MERAISTKPRKTFLVCTLLQALTTIDREVKLLASYIFMLPQPLHYNKTFKKDLHVLNTSVTTDCPT